MNGYDFSDNARNALAEARREAVALWHEYVGTEHVLLGVCANPANMAVSLLASRDVSPDAVRDRVLSIVVRGRTSVERPDLPYTSRAKRIIELAMSEARELNAESVNTGHFLLGIIREEKGIGANVLAGLGFTLDAVRNDFIAMMSAGRGEGSASRGETAAARPPVEMKPTQAAAMLTAMLHSPRVVAVFEKHRVDVQAVIRDLLDDQRRA